MEKKLFSELGLSPELLKAIARIGFEQASPIQTAAIPAILSGADVVGQSQTGSGKTAAFAIPAIERTNAGIKAVQTLILCPTRELAVQVAEEVAKLSLFKRGVRELPIYGGQSYERQFRGLEAGTQIVIGTPGRIMDHLERGSLRLDQLQTVILDEADRMLDMGFIEDIEHILKQAPSNRQTVLFSATLPPPIQNLIRTFTKDAVNIRIAAETMTVPAIDQTYYEVDRRSKVEVLCRLIDLHDIRYAIVFCATKMMVDDVVEHLQARGYSADKLHGDIAQSARERVVAKFRKRSFEFLVATDVAARGLDIDDIEVVFNYDLPHDGEDYVHRIGRTGRAGRAGRAITFVAGREIYKLQNIQRFTKSRIRREPVPSADAVEEKRSQLFFDKLRSTLEAGDYRRHDASVDLLLEAGHSPTEIASALIHLATQDSARVQEPAPTRAKPGARGPLQASGPGPSREEFERTAPNPSRPKRLSEDRPNFARENTEFDTRQNSSAPSAPHKTKRPRPESPREERRPDGFEPRNKFRSESKERGMHRLRFNIGRQHEVSPGDLVGVIAGVTRIPKEHIGAIRLQDRSSVVDVSEEVSALVLKKLNKIKFKGHRLLVSPMDAAD
ncbi:MAG: DEAD-box ATP-dependent helicase CshA [Verrucomicrobiota bacterium]